MALHTFDVEDEPEILELKSRAGKPSRKVEICPLDYENMGILEKLQEQLVSCTNEDISGRIEILWKQIDVLSPTSKRKDFKGIKIEGLFSLVAEMTTIGMTTKRTDDVKKNHGRSNRKLSRSRKKGSAQKS